MVARWERTRGTEVGVLCQGLWMDAHSKCMSGTEVRIKCQEWRMVAHWERMRATEAEVLCQERRIDAHLRCTRGTEVRVMCLE